MRYSSQVKPISYLCSQCCRGFDEPRRAASADDHYPERRSQGCPAGRRFTEETQEHWPCWKILCAGQSGCGGWRSNLWLTLLPASAPSEPLGLMVGTTAKFDVFLTEGAERGPEAIHDYISESDCVANANCVLDGVMGIWRACRPPGTR